MVDEYNTLKTKEETGDGIYTEIREFEGRKLSELTIEEKRRLSSNIAMLCMREQFDIGCNTSPIAPCCGLTPEKIRQFKIPEGARCMWATDYEPDGIYTGRVRCDCQDKK